MHINKEARQTMSKQLITAEVVRTYKQQGQSQFEYDPKLCIVTPEAREVAGELGIEIIISAAVQASTAKVPTSNSAKKLSDRDFNLIREAVLQKMPQGAKISDELLEQLVVRAIKEEQHAKNTPPCNQADNSSTKLKSGIKLVKGNLAKTELFEGALPDNKVSIADVITGQDNSSMSAGYMSWEKGFFPWTLNYDEVQVILEGELHIKSQGETVIGKPGDIIFVPKSSSIEFGTPTKVRFVYIAWPANWQEQS